jgi:hypothetical protein
VTGKSAIPKLGGVHMASPWLLTGNVGTNPNSDFVGTTDNQPLVIKSGSGKVGIGTETPVASLDVGSGVVHVGGATNPTTTQQGAYLGWNALTGGTGETDFINNQGLGSGGFAFMNTPPSGSPISTLMVITGGGDVGIGTSTPASQLDVRSASRIASLYSTTNGNQWVEVGNTVSHMNLGVGASAPTAGVPYLWSASNNFMIGNDGGPTLFIQGMSNGNVGIGTTTPNYPLHMAVGNALRVEGGASANDTAEYFSFGGHGTFGIDAPGLPNGRFVVLNSGNVGIGVTEYALGIAGISSPEIIVREKLVVEGGCALVNGEGGGLIVDSAGLERVGLMKYSGLEGMLVGDIQLAKPIRLGRWDGGTIKAPGTIHEDLVIDTNGNVNVAGDILLTGADCAEQFDVSSPEPPEPGTVLVIDEDGSLRESRDAYDKKVAGVVSGAGDYRHGILLDQKPESEGRVAVALVGKVYCKVDAQYAIVEVGDLLTTSATPGHAMKAADPLKAFGSVIGKALSSLATGTGLIPILVGLQ